MKRLLLIIVALLIALPLIAFAAAHFLLDGDALKTRMVDAVRRATGRELTIAGPVRLTWSLTPTIEAGDVSLANPPGLSRPAMAHADRLEARLALLPLLHRRVEVRRIAVRRPDILLERDAQGRPNWDFSPPPSPPSAQPSPPSAGPRFQLVVGAVEVTDAVITLRQRGTTRTLTAARLDYAPESGAVTGQLAFNGVPLVLQGSAPPTGPLDLRLTGGGVAAAVIGPAAQAAISITAPDLAAASALAGRSLPALHDVQVAATFGRSGPIDWKWQAGASDLGGGVRLVHVAGSAPALDKPAAIQAVLLIGKLPVAVSATTSTLSELFGRGPVPVLLLAAAGDAVLSGSGVVTPPRGFDLTIAAHASSLGPEGLGLSAITDVKLDTKLALAGDTLSLSGMRLTSGQGDLAGDVAITLAPRLAIRGALASQHLALDAWVPPPAPQATAPAAPVPGPAPARAPHSDRVIPDIKLPFALLRRVDADLRLAVAEATWHGLAYHSLEAALALRDGKLRVDPVSARGQGGAVRGQVVADATAQPPTLELTAEAPGLAAGPALALLGAPATTTGTLDLDVALRGQGETVRALAATLDGHLGLAMVDGQIENSWVAELLAQTLRAANLPLDPSGTSRVRCAAIRADAAAGQVRLRALTLDTTRLKLDGEGALDLAHETLDLHLRPQLRLGTALLVPVHVSGSFRTPKVALDAGAIAPGRVGITIGGPAPPDTCGPALALARDGRAGPAPPAPEPVRGGKAADLLRGLFR